MAIEFRCGQCGRLLRTGDDTAGRMAQCPECGSQTPIPLPGNETPVTPVDVEPLESGVPGSSPFGVPPLDSQAGENPYQSPQQAWQAEPQSTPELLFIYAKNRVAGPAVGLIVTGALGLLVHLLALIAVWAQFAVVGNNMNVQPMPNPMTLQLGFGISLAQNALGLGLGILVLVGGMKMKKLEGYSLSMASSIIALVPCFSPCCLLGLPIGIWALVVLSDANVKSAFR